MTELLGRRLVRSLSGRVIHKATCRWAQPAHVKPWYWANTVSLATLTEEIESLGLRPCRICDPLKDLE